MNVIAPAQTLAIVLSLLLPHAAETEPDQVAFELGTRLTIDSPALGRSIDMIVHLPQDYYSGEKRYPVLFMMGSEYRTRFAMFASCLDYMNDGGQIPPVILVGVDLPGGNAALVPREEDTSGADRHLDFLAGDAIPFVDTEFRTAPFYILYGASNGGVFSVYAILKRPSVFNAYIASSPMLGWCANLIENRLTDALAVKEARTRRLCIIYSDDDYPEVTDFVPGFAAMLDKKKPAWMEYQSAVRAGEGHVPTVDLPLAMKMIFPDYNPPVELTTLDSMIRHYRNLSDRYGIEISIPASLLFDSGMDHAMAQRLGPAEEIFEYFVEHNPEDSKAYAGLGLVRRDQNRPDDAAALLRKALEIDPDNRLARRLLDRLD